MSDNAEKSPRATSLKLFVLFKQQSELEDLEFTVTEEQISN